MLTIDTLLKEGERLLAPLPHPKREARALLAFLLEVNSSYLLAFPEKKVSGTLRKHYYRWLKKRATGYPLAYIRGWQEFYGLRLKVTPATLIPRPDTECLVELALTLIQHHQLTSFLDLGTGSGAIPLAILATLRAQSPTFESLKATATDISQASLKVTEVNAKNLQLPLELIVSNWFSNISQTYDLIVTNPPYIDSQDPHLTGDSLKYEPHHALIAQDSGYADLYAIIKEAPLYLNRGGFLLLEHGYTQGQAVSKALVSQGFSRVQTLKDYGANDRVTYGRYLNQ